jgi:hypothetical protein
MASGKISFAIVRPIYRGISQGASFGYKYYLRRVLFVFEKIEETAGVGNLLRVAAFRLARIKACEAFTAVFPADFYGLIPP